MLLDEAKSKDDSFGLLGESNLEGLLAGFGYKVAYISRCYNKNMNRDRLPDSASDKASPANVSVSEDEAGQVSARGDDEEMIKDPAYNPETAPDAQFMAGHDTSPIAVIRAESDRIHTENLNYTPTIPNKTIFCHIVTDSILPAGQRNTLKALEQETRSGKYSEKVVSLSVKDSIDPEEFMKELEIVKAREEAKYPYCNIRFDVACHNKELVAKIQDRGIKALAFSREGEGDIIQIEGIILALRALQTGSIDNLLGVYKFITGMEITSITNDIDELARMMLFILPVTKVDVNEIGRVNRIMEENIKTAA
jgi:hypothetical protein